MRCLTILVAAVLALCVPASASAVQPFPGYPENAENFPYFATPSGRIACGYRAKLVSCTTYQGSERGQDEWYVKSQGRGRYHSIDGNYPSENLPRAKYGVTYLYRSIRCRIHRLTGIKCWNEAGHGFRVSIEKRKTF